MSSKNTKKEELEETNFYLAQEFYKLLQLLTNYFNGNFPNKGKDLWSREDKARNFKEDRTFIVY